MTVRFDDDSKPCVRVLLVGGHGDGQWIHVAADPDNLRGGGFPLTLNVSIAGHNNRQTDYRLHRFRNGDENEWIGTPYGVHDPFQYFMSLYSTNALKGK